MKKLLILGANPETIGLVKQAISMGIYTIVIDPFKDAPAKEVADQSFDIDGFDVEGICEVARDQNIDGVMVGAADILVSSYYRVCKKLNFPCYVNEETAIALTNKSNFIEKCKEYGVSTTPRFNVNIDNIESESHLLPYPLMVKPTDMGGGAGMQIVSSKEEILEKIRQAYDISIKKEVMIEKYMNCHDMLAYYNFKDGAVRLAGVADRYTSKKSSKGSPVCIGALYPSIYLEKFLDEVNPKVTRMLKSMGIKNGVLNLQFFYDNQNFYAYDPGFRIQGEAPHIYLKEFFDLCNLSSLIKFALGENSIETSFAKLDPHFPQHACTIWVLLKEGEIAHIEGIKEIESRKGIIFNMQRLYKGDCVESDMIGTEKQVFARIYIVGNKSEVKKNIQYVQQTLEILDSTKNNLILDMISENELENNEH